MNTLQRHVVYLEAQGITPLMLREPVVGALPSVDFLPFDNDDGEQDIQQQSSSPHGEYSVTAVAEIVADAVDTVVITPAKATRAADSSIDNAKTTNKENNKDKKIATFNFTVLTAGSLLVIDEIQSHIDRKQSQQLINNMAAALLSKVVQPTFLDLNWPLKDHHALDHSEEAARSFIHSWLEPLVIRQQIRLIILMGDAAKNWFSAAVDELHLPVVVVSSVADMLLHNEKKADCWRLVRPYQSLVSTASAKSDNGG